jgi:hypothetical protein
MNKPVLFKRGDQLFACVQEDELPVTVVLARFSKGFQSEIAILHQEHEIALLDGIHELDEASQKFALEELQKNYLIPKISKVNKAEVFLGNRYIHAETGSGERCFIVKNPFVSVRKIPQDGLLIRDTIGNMYLIDSLGALDKHSKKQLNMVL